MDESPHIVALCGSLRDESYTRQSLLVALAGAEAAGATIDLIDLRKLELPLFDADSSSAGDAEELARRIERGDGVILGTPMYHGSYAAPLKNALDYCGFEEFEDKTVGLLAVSGGSFPVTTLEHLRSTCRALNAWVIPHQVAVPNAHSAFSDGKVKTEGLEERIETLGWRAVDYANIEPDPDSFEGDRNVGA